MPRDIGALEFAIEKAVLGSLLLGIGGQVVGVGEEVHEGLVAADTVGEHATVVAVVVDAPLDFDDLVRRVSGHDRLAPVGAGLVVVNANASVVATRSAATYRGGFNVGPSSDGFEDGAFGTGVDASLREGEI